MTLPPLSEFKKFWPPRAAVEEAKKRWQPQSLLAISIESRRLIAELVRRPGTEGKSWGIELPLGAEAVILDPDVAGAALAAELAAGGIRERRCVICVPPSWALATSLDIPAMSSEDLRGFLELRAEREFPIAAADLRLGYTYFQPQEGSLRATLAALPIKRLRALERILEVAGCRAVSISLGLTGARVFAPATSSGGDGPAYFLSHLPSAVHLLANCDTVDVVVTAGGGIAALRSIAGPPATEAAFDPAGFCREVRITLGRLPEPLRRQVTEAHFGGVRTTAETLCLKTREQFHRMGVEPTTIDREEEPPAHEAALQFFRQESMPFEFITPQVNKWEKVLARFEKKQHRQLLGAGVAALVLLFLIFFIRSRMVTHLEKEWAGMRDNVADLEIVQQKIRQFRPWFTAQPESLPVLETLVSAFPDSGEAWAKSIQVTDATKVSCTGFARNQAAFIALRERLRKHAGVTEVQVQQMRGENPVEFSFFFKTDQKP